ncbi:kinesin-like protein KIF28P isoform X2 [Corticium candelabrum]|uniref:kinesin-like protein KIF28P isoform X2 n=1 Tax=Corticium candelabrum TaxID=121492 RepID=UPI002E277292|nr:kinesin-like protein KIF28P isoform X2 [Corticium candelabrum]
MEGARTWIQDPDNLQDEPKSFTFDHSYWSFDGYRELENGYLEPTSPQYADQKKVFDDLGRSVLTNAWLGYNCSLFAYGQTGSGKSYSVVGYGPNKGIVPMFCEQLFDEINQKVSLNAQETEYQVSFSMLEIYNEKVRDLLNPKGSKSSGLKVRQHPKTGFYIPELLIVPVDSFKDISNRMNEGTQNRTVASTNMNKTSSRAHTVVTLKFTQKGKSASGANTTKTSNVNLVDLAGSERADSTGATGERLKEGAAINQSLSALGNVIAALADNKSGTIVPYRDSVLTKLLKNALGGNSKTIMVAALSPADINYEETLSTLRYADRAKQIKTKAVVNESPTEKLIRELREENDKLLLLLKQGGSTLTELTATGTEDDGDAEELRAQLEENEKQMNEMKQNWEQKLKDAHDALQERDNEEERKKQELATVPHFYNLNVDPQLTRMIVHTLKQGHSTVGSKGKDSKPDILLIGLNILQQHAEIVNIDGSVSLTPNDGAAVRINGELVTSKISIHHNDRILFGSNHLYVFQHPAEHQSAKQNGIPIQEVSYDEAQEEIARCSGIDVNSGNSGDQKADQLLKEELTEMIPMVNEANAISEELDRRVQFEIAILPAIALGRDSDHSEVWVRMNSLVNDQSWLWPRNKFINRKYLMSEMYENYVDGENWKLPDERDPFTENPDTEILIGSTTVYLQNLAYLVDLRNQYELLDYCGNKTGVINVDLVPCRADGTEISDEDNDDDLFVDNPSELIGRSVSFYVKIPNCRGLPRSIYKEVWCRYIFYVDNDPTETNHIEGTSNPDFNHARLIVVPAATKQFVNYVTNQYVRFEVWGKYDEANVSKATHNGTTRELIKSKKQQSGVPAGKNLPKVALDMWRKRGEQEGNRKDLQQRTIRRKTDCLEKKMALIVQLLDKAEQQNKKTVKIADIRQILSGSCPSGRSSVVSPSTVSVKAVHVSTQTSKSNATKGPRSRVSSSDSNNSKSSDDKSRTCSLV